MYAIGQSARVSGPRLMLVLCVLLGLVGQLALSAGAAPGEVPRATLERLTGLVVTSAAPMAMPDDGMPGMAMPAATHHAPQPGHDADHGCFLCPLLALAPAIFAKAALLPGRFSTVSCVAYRLPEARAPPARPISAAFPRGPPRPFC